MISKYFMLIMSLISHNINIVYPNNVDFGAPNNVVPYFYSVPENNVFQTYERPYFDQRNVQYQGYNRLPQVAANVNLNNEERNNVHQSYYGDRRDEPQGNLINHPLWNMLAQLQALIQHNQLEKQKQYEVHLLKNQEEIKKQREEHEKMLKEETYRRNVAQRSKYLQRRYYDYMLHDEYNENELETQTNKPEETQ